MENHAPNLLLPWDDAARAGTRMAWQSLKCTMVFENPWVRFESHDVIAPTGSPGHYGVTRFKNRAVAVVPLFDDGTIIMIGQHRFTLGRYSWEVPEGGVPFDEDLLEGGQRELAEEAGLSASHWQKILDLDLSNSVTDEVATCYLATGLTQTRAHPDETESLEIARVPFKDVLKAVISGQVRDSLTIASVLRVHHMAVTGELTEALSEIILAY